MQLNRFKHNNNFIIAAIFMLAIILFLCSSMLIHVGPSMDSSSRACCSHSGGEAAFQIHHMTSMLTSRFMDLMPSLMVMAVVIMPLVFFFRFTLLDGSNYFRAIRDKYGGFGVLNYFRQLFSSGILHSKIFSYELVN